MKSTLKKTPKGFEPTQDVFIMTPEEIRRELFKIRKELNMSDIARSLDPPVSPQSIGRVIDRDFVSNRIMEAVATAIGRDKKYVFPDYFLKKTG